MSEFIVQVTGSRFWRDPVVIGDALDVLADRHGPLRVRHGRCPPRWHNNSYVSWETGLKMEADSPGVVLRGADWLADRHARMRGWEVEQYPADWNAHGKAGGGIRNQEMVDLTPRAHLALGFLHPGSSGTRDCLRRAKRALIPRLEFFEDEERDAD